MEDGDNGLVAHAHKHVVMESKQDNVNVTDQDLLMVEEPARDPIPRDWSVNYENVLVCLSDKLHDFVRL